MTQTETQTITMEYELAHAPAKVWRAISDPALVAQWLMSNDLKAEVGHTFRFTSQPTEWWDGIVNCEVLEAEPNKRLSYAWRSGKPEMGGLDTVVTWTLTPTSSGGTMLSLVHTGFNAGDKFAADGAIKGWTKMMEVKLPAVLEKMD
jgi:uncharacterized protein YndB with AHSA1/START domain